MNEKKTETKRLLLFLLLTFAISWIPAIIYNHVFGFRNWFETNKMPALVWPVLFGPALANILTRLITKEGLKDSKLTLKLNGYLKYYIIALALPTVLDILTKFFATVVFGGGDFTAPVMPGLKTLLPALLMGYVTAPLLAFITFGEEFGWRGYMNPKMEKLIGKPGTIILGGIIWGLWHAPLTVEGHNFGKEYDGYPYLGIAAMCVIFIVTGTILMWLTDRTASIIPACIMHAMINYEPTTIGDYFLRGSAAESAGSVGKILITEIPKVLIAALFAFLLCRKQRQDTVKN